MVLQNVSTMSKDDYSLYLQLTLHRLIYLLANEPIHRNTSNIQQRADWCRRTHAL